ncbi:MAG: aminodeoxychorismate synthase component I [Pirellulaceae bacterium]
MRRSGGREPDPLPLVEELTPPPAEEDAFCRLARQPHCLFLDSALRHPQLGRYSFLAADPFALACLPLEKACLADVRGLLQPYAAPSVPGLPPFQGGAAGLFSYDLNRSLERIPPPRFDEFRVPALAIGLYDTVLAYDHLQSRAWLVSHGFPEREPDRRRERAARRIEQFRAWLRDQASPASSAESRGAPLSPDARAPQFPAPGPAGLTSSFSREQFLGAVDRAREYIRAGDIFQVNLAQRLLFPARDDAVSLYLRLRRRNPATFAAYFDIGDGQVVSASPERFVSLTHRRVETRPIKGTRPRTARPEADLFAADDLRQSEKDRAENVMIVDLLRNDLSRVCRPDSIHVSQLCRLEVYQFVQHLVSVVRGQLADDCAPFDVIPAAFPGGSITGAPKVRAMEIIAELEPTARGAYCGSLGYLGFDGSLDLNILIRTITVCRGWWQLPVGGGIVAQSEAEREYEETWHKATGLVRSLLP